MNVYYCDVCGVRVTDTDLHSGHGMRRRHDVVCAACLELGHGKGLLGIDADKAAERKQLAYAGNGHADGESAPQGGAAKERPAASDALAAARDRLHTQDEDEAPAPVKARAVLPDATPVHGQGEGEMFNDTAKVPIVVQELGATAAGFAALTPPPQRASDTGAEDVVEVPANRLDDQAGSQTPSSGPEAVSAETTDAEAGEGEGESELAIEERSEDGDPEKAETTSSGRVEGAPARKGEGKPGSSSRRATSSSRVTKQTKSRSGRRKKDPNRQLIVISLIGMGSMVVLFSLWLLIFSGASSSKKRGVIEVTNMSKELADMAASVKEAEAAAFDNTSDVAKAQEALTKLKALNDESIKFGDLAKDKGWTDDQVDAEIEQLGITDLKAQRKRLEDQVVANSSH